MEDDIEVKMAFVPLKVEDVEIQEGEVEIYHQSLNIKSIKGKLFYTNGVISGYHANEELFGYHVLPHAVTLVNLKNSRWVETSIVESANPNPLLCDIEDFQSYLTREVDSCVKLAALKLKAFSYYETVFGYTNPEKALKAIEEEISKLKDTIAKISSPKP